MIDSGSDKTYIKTSVANKLRLFIIPRNKSVPLANSSIKADICGETVADIELNGHLHRGIVVEIMDNLCVDLLVGKDLMKKHKRVVLKFNGPRDELVLGAVQGEKPKPTLTPMDVSPPPLFTNLTSNIKPIATKTRKHPPADLKYLKEQVDELYRNGIIRPSVSPWRAQPLIVPETETHKKRMAIDYSNTINIFTELDAYPMPGMSKMVQDISQFKFFATFDLKSAYHQVPIRESDAKYTAFEVDGELWEFTRIPFGVTNGVSAFQRTVNKIIKKEGLKSTFAYVDNVTVCGHTEEELKENVNAWIKTKHSYNITLNDEKTVHCTQTLPILGYVISNGCIQPDCKRLKPLLEMPPPTTPKAQKRLVGMFSYYSKFIKNFSDKICCINRNTVFPLPPDVLEAFQVLKNDLKEATLQSIDLNETFVVETDASDFCIAATLNQKGRPVAFFSRTLNSNEIKHHSVEKEAAAIVESIQEWRYFLLGRKFKLITDQRSVGFMYDSKRRSKIKNDKIGRWRVELSEFKFDITYRPGKENVAADTFSRIASVGHPIADLREIHEQLCHPGITRLAHFIRMKNLPYTLEEVKTVAQSCHSCALLKPRFLRINGTLIKAIAPFQRLSIDFKGPLPVSSKGNQYLLTIIDEYSRFPFAFPCPNMKSGTVTSCFNKLFSLFGLPGMVHNDRASDFLSEETLQYLNNKGISTSKTSRYNPKCNGQVEKLNGTLWKAIQVSLHSRKLKLSEWETVLPDALHSIRSLLCTSTNATPHERLFSYTRKSTAGKSIPSWVKPGPVYLKNHVKKNKYEAPVTPATLLHVNPEYAHVRLPSGTETTVSLRDVAPYPVTESVPLGDSIPDTQPQVPLCDGEDMPVRQIDSTIPVLTNHMEQQELGQPYEHDNHNSSPQTSNIARRCSSRANKNQLPMRFNDFEMGPT